MTLERVSLDDAVMLLSLPRTVGIDPADGAEITAQNGRYGPYVSKGKESRSLDNEERLFTVTLDEALALLAAPKQYRGRGRSEPKPPLAEFGVDPASGRPIVAKEGRFGVYVTDGETNASIGRGDRIETMTAERAHELLAVRRETIAAGGGAPRRPAKRAPAKKATASKKAGATKKAATPKKAAAPRKAAPGKKA
jgi:DNA topoisomerase-1